MSPAFLVRLRPKGPWRFGPESGARDRVDRIFHSDTLYSAVTWAMAQLRLMNEWIAMTAESDSPVVRFSSCFPYSGDVMYVVPPRTHWPPNGSSKVRWKGARFVPLTLVQSLLAGNAPDQERWAVDPVSQCLVPVTKNGALPGPFRVSLRTSAAVDRVTQGIADVHSTACLEFSEGAGLWCVVTFADEGARGRWANRIRSAFRLLADSGVGGERSRGWGRALMPRFTEGVLPELLLPRGSAVTAQVAARVEVAPMVSEVEPEPEMPAPDPEPTPEIPSDPEPEPEIPAPSPDPDPEQEPEPDPQPETPGEPNPDSPTDVPLEAADSEPEPVLEVQLEPEPEPEPERPREFEGAFVMHPAAQPGANETAWWLLSVYSPGAGESVNWQRGNYNLTTRSGRIESSERWGDLKPASRVVEEGSVLIAEAAPVGASLNVAPDGFPHPVYRFGFAVALPLPQRGQP
jgi:CRISPR type III-A-associated RAMP protein Csm4